MASDAYSAAHAADTEVLIRRSMTKGYELFSLLTPPIYTAFILARKGRGHFTINRLLRATWLGGAVGCAGGGALEYARSINSNEVTVRSRRMRHAYDTSSLRADDHSTVGAILFAVLTPAIFWKRANIANLILGGAGFGSAAGFLTHYGRTFTGDPAPRVEVPQMPVSSQEI
ncbi:hypothetical protein SERLA73DRAFT_76156 [Serpula lacrymans var. lacrymans S7.3]|uniref:Uncharacterized protein n=2 Tax=Serpula lacrymans var. lacrymans TaxID=341189 RepID=F8Q6C8_SERL3|nr:uncharacterized protein SERLADRAFT_372349 [Serpula lacrymans var. lacrymans S7.9]EGN96166.1 hypothetical protein SERLA73DRAFT_76156 [Serpula lacrymans var. lacrymans S7.3]EGO21710.1 hypothetical protein SERLADRAFT_372349 [Serpula lacrymans var. lacrymans S7.9]